MVKLNVQVGRPWIDQVRVMTTGIETERAGQRWQRVFSRNQVRGIVSSERNSVVWQCNGYSIYNGIGVHLKKLRRFPHVSPCVQSLIERHVHPVRMPESLYPLSSHFDNLRTKGAKIQKANINHGKQNMNKTLKRGELPCVRQ
jgi:hypothetical protein